MRIPSARVNFVRAIAVYWCFRSLAWNRPRELLALFGGRVCMSCFYHLYCAGVRLQ